jgi:hypothetical protein
VVFKEGKMSKVRWGKGVYGMMRYMRMVSAGNYQLKWQDDVVDVHKMPDIGYHRWYVYVNGSFKHDAKTLDAAMSWVANVWGREEVETFNLLNPQAGKVMIARCQKGGCCDPGTERYWTM